MDVMLQRHCARYIYVIPDGLRELMSDISREVLRCQPINVYTFIADYLDALMITRENARVAARLVESLTEMATTTATFLEETGLPRDEVDNIVTAIQKTFRKSIDSEQGEESQLVEEEHIVSNILSEIQVSPEQAKVAAIVIQQAYRRFKERKEREKELLSGMVDWRVAARSAIHLYRKTGVTNEEANRAATLIKAAYKGYYTRRIIKDMAALAHDNIDDLPRYLQVVEEEGEDEEGYVVDDGDDNDEKTRSVKIDFNTVIPHVDFDTDDAFPPDISARVSTASSAARYSLKFIFDSALETLAGQSVIPEETAEEGNEMVAELEETSYMGETAIRQDTSDTTGESSTKRESAMADEINAINKESFAAE